MYKGDRWKEVCRLFGRQKRMHIAIARHRNYRQVLNWRSRYRRKTKNRLPPKNFRRIALPPNNYRRIALPPKKYYRFRQSRYRRQMKNRLPQKNYRRKNTAIVWFTPSAKVVTAKNEKPANRLKITAVWQYRPACVRLKNRYRWPPWFFSLSTHLDCLLLYAVPVGPSMTARPSFVYSACYVSM